MILLRQIATGPNTRAARARTPDEVRMDELLAQLDSGGLEPTRMMSNGRTISRRFSAKALTVARFAARITSKRPTLDVPAGSGWRKL